ncbi:fumarylacetoacetate hydrolase family protein [Mycobacterium sp. 236(2023)]|uniref:fumarylacetoacetate hydrolase family protein n=1 Tax=Mycobacterium sp. 236(2023) TaxID=3038163 RepID=UPI002415745B|nr:fumarylacetoacetate hydrolase family protein [Mycobacterium sp. 236(2023)]MDG4669376.1 fumarylacetoacetate hydrolase family protein [Mycobacterium sp. 236(2023)]
MQIIRFTENPAAAPRWGVLVGDTVHQLDGHWSDPQIGSAVAAVDDVELRSPCQPQMIVCAGANYRSQLTELGLAAPSQPVLFLKGLNTIAGPHDVIRYPVGLNRLEYEGELAVVIGRTASHVKACDALAYVLGYTCANDVTASDFRGDGQWTRAKSADTFCPMGPWIETDIADPQALGITTQLNGHTVQQCGTDDMVFGVAELIEWITRWITLNPGDVILTASPAGVGPMQVGDRVEVAISGIGTLTNIVDSTDVAVA